MQNKIRILAVPTSQSLGTVSLTQLLFGVVRDLLDQARGHASDDAISWDVISNDRSCGNHASSPNSHTRQNRYTCADPNIVFNDDRARDSWPRAV
jgi:hypothetical protein